MATTKLYLDLRGKAKDRKGSVVILLYHNASTVSIPTGIRVYPENWNKSKQRVIDITGAEAINVSLQKQKTQVDERLAFLSLASGFDRMTASDIKNELTGNRKRNDKHLLSDLFDEYINTGNLKQGTKDIYLLAKKKVIAFSGERFYAENINLAWLRAFDLELAKTQSVNGKSIYLRALRAVLNYALHNDIEICYPFKNFQIKSEPTRKRCLPVETLRELLNRELDGWDSVARDYFFLMFYLIGINFKDLLLAKRTQVNDGRLEYLREKTGRKYSIKIEPEAESLLRKYYGADAYLLEAMDHCVHYKSFARRINESLNDIAGITSYFARHSWATCAYEIGIPMDTISQALGHSFGNRTTLIYVKPDQSKVDIANRKVIDYLIG